MASTVEQNKKMCQALMSKQQQKTKQTNKIKSRLKQPKAFQINI